jgi:hypothetical protein
MRGVDQRNFGTGSDKIVVDYRDGDRHWGWGHIIRALNPRRLLVSNTNNEERVAVRFPTEAEVIEDGSVWNYRDKHARVIAYKTRRNTSAVIEFKIGMYVSYDWENPGTGFAEGDIITFPNGVQITVLEVGPNGEVYRTDNYMFEDVEPYGSEGQASPWQTQASPWQTNGNGINAVFNVWFYIYDHVIIDPGSNYKEGDMLIYGAGSQETVALYVDETDADGGIVRAWAWATRYLNRTDFYPIGVIEMWKGYRVTRLESRTCKAVGIHWDPGLEDDIVIPEARYRWIRTLSKMIDNGLWITQRWWS